MAEVELQQIGAYSITELLRVSSTSTYYKGHGKLRKKEFLIKRLNTAFTSLEEKEAFLVRGKQLKKLANRNISRFNEVGFDQEHGYLAVEYISGQTLKQQIPEGSQFAPDEVKKRLSPIAAALQYAHTSNVLHGNLHPGTILVGPQNDLILTEFALTLSDYDDEAIAYSAPEQLRGKPDAASDQYSLAVMAYEWLCGKRPYRSTERTALLAEQEQGTIPPPSSLNPAISAAVEQVVLKALAFQPEERFSHVMQFSDHYLSALMGFPANTSEQPRLTVSPPSLPPAPTKRTRKVSHPKIQVTAQKAPEIDPTHTIIPSTPHEEIKVQERPEVTQTQDISATPHLQPIKAKTAPIPIERIRNRMFTTHMAEDEPLPGMVAEESGSYSTERPYAGPIPKKQLRPSGVNDAVLQAMITNDLCQGGVLSQRLPGYEERPAQVEMASVVAQAISQKVPAIIEASTGTGKALDINTPIPTPDGWKNMGDLVVGDLVFDEQGQPTSVTAAFEIMDNRPCYEVTFSDGSSLIADAEHEWVTYTCTDRKRTTVSYTDTYLAKKFVTPERLALLDQLIALPEQGNSLSVDAAVTLIGGHHWSVYQEARKLATIKLSERPARYPYHTLLIAVRNRLAKGLVEQCRDQREYTLITTRKMAETLTVSSVPRANHAIKLASPLKLPEQELPIAPYFLGAWLGDGNSRSNQITTADPDLNTEIEKDGYTVRSLKSKLYLYAVDDKNGKATNRWQPGMIGRLRNLNLLLNKHIPTLYLRAAEQQRRALLAGLLDTDGTVSRTGAIEFTTTTPQLAKDIYELICSLGFRPTTRCGRAHLKGKDCGAKWTISFTTQEIVFRLPRKILAQRERLRNYSPERNRFRYVVSVNEVPSRPVRCIQVEAASHLYLAGRSMVPTHNSLAYLVPTVRSGKVAIVSTANKALQEQLFYKDIPFIQKHIKEFPAALVKGFGNYVCLDRLEAEKFGIQFYSKNKDFQRLYEFVNDPESDFSGDFETVTFPVPGDIRGKVMADSDQCAWSKCSFYGECYVRQMRDSANLAQIIVVNHTLLLIDAAMGGFLLPERDVIILDEAHHLEEEATRSFTTTINSYQVTSLLAQRMLKDHSQLRLQDEVIKTASVVWSRLEQIATPAFKGRWNLESPMEEGLRLATVVSDLTDSLRRQKPKNMAEKDEQLYDKLVKRSQNLAEGIRTVFSVADTNKFVYYIDRSEGPRSGTSLQASAAPLDVTDWLQEKLFDKCNVICTSATLATTGAGNAQKPGEKTSSFSYYKKRVGLDTRPELLERVLPLTFDYESHALLYTPRHLPEPTFGPGADEYALALAREMYKLVKFSRGRAFLLFSSKRMLDQAYDLMEPHLPYQLLKQGDMSRIELTRQFRRESSVLFGLKSFWEGVDIAGEALSLVVIDKLPFDPPDDPVHEARVAHMKAAGENWFGNYVLPQAVLRLKQGIGRLLRTHDDRGVMAILDTRLHTKSYGKTVLNALPPARRTSNIRDVERFFAEEPDI